MKTLINDTLRKVDIEFKDQITGKCLCELKNIRFDHGYSPDYSLEEIQQLYMLRYYPAYLCEYKYLYKLVIRTTLLTKFNILSVGCGCCVDYHGAYLALDRSYKDISYHGIDLVQWKYIDTFGNTNFHFLRSNINNIRFPKENVYNIIMFPKSISEFDDSSLDTFITDLRKSKFSAKNLFLISSAMNQGFVYDEQKYKKVVEFLKEIGYTLDKYEPPKEIKVKGGLVNLDPEFDYPDEIIKYITSLSNYCANYQKNNRNCKNDCQNSLNKSPILTTRYMSFQLNQFNL